MKRSGKTSNNVTSVCDDGQQENAHKTIIFSNRSLHHCFYNNRGYCRFRETCRYQHFHDICLTTFCKDPRCENRHPVYCKYKEHCKFHKKGICAFKHSKDNTEETDDLKSEIKYS